MFEISVNKMNRLTGRPDRTGIYLSISINWLVHTWHRGTECKMARTIQFNFAIAYLG